MWIYFSVILGIFLKDILPAKIYEILKHYALFKSEEIRWKYLPCVEIFISGKISAFPPSDSKTWVQEERNTVEQSKEGTQLGPGLESHLFTY